MMLIICLMVLAISASSENTFSNYLDNAYHKFELRNTSQPDNDNINCSTSNVTVSLNKLTYTLYNTQYQKNGILLSTTSLDEVNPENRVVFIIHGWGQNGTYEWITLMKDLYLSSSDANIIVLDWSAYAGLDFTDAFCSILSVGNFTGDLIHNLTRFDVKLNSVQINGFSFGAHISGYAGKRVQALTGSKIARINGLDAAGQGYGNLPTSQRLYKSDASFVQAIHTSGNSDGFGPPYATVDFFVNYDLFSEECGTSQIGCPLFPGVPGNSSSNFMNCDHIRAVAYFTESIISKNFIGVECYSCSEFKNRLCSQNDKTVMGENCPSSASGSKYLTTNYKPPFAKGNTGTRSA